MVSVRVELLGELLPVAAAAVLGLMPRESGGLIAVDASGVGQWHRRLPVKACIVHGRQPQALWDMRLDPSESLNVRM